MSLVTKVKVGNITNLSEARYCAGMGVDFLGFPTGSSRLPVETFREIISWVSAPQFVLELEDRMYTGNEIDQLLIDYGVPCVECTSRHFAALSGLPTTPSVLPAILAQEWDSVKGMIEDFNDQVVAIRVLPSPSADWAVISAISQRHLVLVDFEMVDDLQLLAAGKIGISLSGTEEMKPGLKQYQHLADVLEKLEVD